MKQYMFQIALGVTVSIMVGLINQDASVGLRCFGGWLVGAGIYMMWKSQRRRW